MDLPMFFYAIFAGLALWWLVKSIQNNPELFSKANANKTALTLGYLALALIGFVVLCIMLLRS